MTKPIIVVKVPCKLLYVIQVKEWGTTRGHSYKIFKPHATTRVRSNFFVTRSVDAWNRLPEYIIEAQSTNSFKNLFNTYYSNQMFVLDS